VKRKNVGIAQEGVGKVYKRLRTIMYASSVAKPPWSR